MDEHSQAGDKIGYRLGKEVLDRLSSADMETLASVARCRGRIRDEAKTAARLLGFDSDEPLLHGLIAQLLVAMD